MSFDKRSPPYFCNYASDFMAEEEYVLASLHERGLLWTLLNHCWVNGSIPADENKMASLLGKSIDQVRDATGKLIKKHFQPCANDPMRLTDPELDRQRRELADYRERLKEGGRRGGISTQEKFRARIPTSSPATSPASSPATSPASSPAKAPEMRGDEMKCNASIEKSKWPAEHAEWGAEYDSGEPDFLAKR